MFDSLSHDKERLRAYLEQVSERIVVHTTPLVIVSPEFGLGEPAMVEFSGAGHVVSYVAIGAGQQNDIHAESFRVYSSSLTAKLPNAAMRLLGIGYPEPPTASDCMERMFRRAAIRPQRSTLSVVVRGGTELIHVRAHAGGPLLGFDVDLVEMEAHVSVVMCNLSVAEPVELGRVDDVSAVRVHDRLVRAR